MFAPALSQVAQLYLPSLHSPSSCSNDRCQYSLGGAPNFSVGWGPYCALRTGALFLVEGRRKAWPAAPSAAAPSPALSWEPCATLTSVY